MLYLKSFKKLYFSFLFISIAVSPDMSSTPKTLEKTWNGNPVNLTCISEAIPNASISWFYDNKKIQNDDFYTIYSRTAHSNLQVCSFIYYEKKNHYSLKKKKIITIFIFFQF